MAATSFRAAAFHVAAIASAVLTLSGCGTVSIPVTMDVPGEFKLSGVSKIALLEFNTIPSDAFAGIAAADEETRELVRRAVASAFYASPMYDIVDLAAERQIGATETSAVPDKRFDAVVTGRLWWQKTDETDGEEPHVFKLETWKIVPYTTKAMGKEVQAKAHVTTRTDEELRMLPYRSRHAALMLALSIYRVGINGELEKIVDTYQMTDKGFVVANGSLEMPDATFGPERRDAVAKHKKAEEPKEEGGSWGAFGTELIGGFVKIGQQVASDVEKVTGAAAAGEDDSTAPAVDGDHDAAGKVILPNDTATIPTDLQARLILAAKLSEDLTRRIAPSKETFNIPYEFDDAKLASLLREGAYGAAEQYVVRSMREALGREYATRIGPLEAYGEPDYPVPPTSDDDRKTVEHKKRGFQQDKFVELLLDRKIDQLLFALGLCQEATGRADEALYTYRAAFDLTPDQSPAQGMARCRIALGSAARVQEQAKEQKKASKKAGLD